MDETSVAAKFYWICRALWSKVFRYLHSTRSTAAGWKSAKSFFCWQNEFTSAKRFKVLHESANIRDSLARIDATGGKLHAKCDFNSIMHVDLAYGNLIWSIKRPSDPATPALWLFCYSSSRTIRFVALSYAEIYLAIDRENFQPKKSRNLDLSWFDERKTLPLFGIETAVSVEQLNVKSMKFH